VGDVGEVCAQEAGVLTAAEAEDEELEVGVGLEDPAGEDEWGLGEVEQRGGIRAWREDSVGEVVEDRYRCGEQKEENQEGSAGTGRDLGIGNFTGRLGFFGDWLADGWW